MELWEALWAIRLSLIRVAVNHSGDSDSTGAICGNVLGAYLGLDAISESWKDSLELYDLIYILADDLSSEIPVDMFGAVVEGFSDDEAEKVKNKYLFITYKGEVRFLFAP